MAGLFVSWYTVRMDILLPIIAFFLGTIIGSFLNVVILRLRSGRTLGGRSACFTCGMTLSFAELVPVGSFLTQRGRCAHCRAKISWQYPLVEMLSGLVFVLLYFRFAYLLLLSPAVFAGLFLYFGIVLSLLIVLAGYDARHTILPDGLTAVFALVAFLGMFLVSGDSFVLHMPPLWHFLAGVLIPMPFAVLWLASGGKWMGLGDAKLMIGIGWLLGLSGGIAAVLLSFWIGAAASLLWLLALRVAGRRGASLKTALPFGPFLAIGTAVALLARIDLAAIARIFSV